VAAEHGVDVDHLESTAACSGVRAVAVCRDAKGGFVSFRCDWDPVDYGPRTVAVYRLDGTLIERTAS
jgi:hypothetical protein